MTSSDPVSSLSLDEQNEQLRSRVAQLEKENKAYATKIDELEQQLIDALAAFEDDDAQKKKKIDLLQKRIIELETQATNQSKTCNVPQEENKAQNPQSSALNLPIIDHSGNSVTVSNSQARFKLLYFSASWCGPCKAFTPKLIKFYSAVNQSSKQVEIVFVSGDRDEKSFQEYYKQMPWLAIKFQSQERMPLGFKYGIKTIPSLILINDNGDILNHQARADIDQCNENAFATVLEKWKECKVPVQAGAQPQQHHPHQQRPQHHQQQHHPQGLITPAKPPVLNSINSEGNPTPLKDSPAKVKMLYFSAHWCPPCRQMTPKLVQFYNRVNKNSKQLEIVFVSMDKDEAAWESYYESMPWLALDYKDSERLELIKNYFVTSIPRLVLLGEGGKELLKDAVAQVRNILEANETDKIFETWEKIVEQGGVGPTGGTGPTPGVSAGLLEKVELDSFKVVDGSSNVVDVKGSDTKVKALYFSASWCPPCRNFTPKLVKFYQKINKDSKRLEIVFVSRDKDINSFKQYFGIMPWVAVEYSGPERDTLTKKCGNKGIPQLMLLNREGKVILKDGRMDVESMDESKYENVFDRWLALAQK